jgi:uracil-DNA glycosylase
MDNLLKEISKCKICEPYLENGVRPVLLAHPKSKIIVIGQAPGIKVHQSGIPWDDKSGENLRNWMNISQEDFYDPQKIGIVPMGFCYPGKGKTGDLPPRKECATTWHHQLWDQMEDVELILLIGQYAQNYYLKDQTKRTLTETVRSFKDYLPKYFVLPHPSPRNNIWQAKNSWFKEEVLPTLKESIFEILKE